MTPVHWPKDTSTRGSKESGKNEYESLTVSDHGGRNRSDESTSTRTIKL